MIFSPQTIILMHSSFVDSQVCKNSSNMFGHGTIQWIVNKPPKPTHFAHYHSFDPIQIHYIFGIFLVSTGVYLWVTLVGELPSSTCSFPLCLIINLDHALVSTTTSMSRESCSMSQNPPSTGVDKKSIGCSIFYATSVVFFSSCFSSS